MRLLKGFLIGLIIIISSNAIGQIKTDDLFCDTCLVKVPYKYLKKMRVLTVEYDFMKIEIDSLYKRANLYKQALLSSDVIIAMQDSIISIKEKQLKIFENTPQVTQVIKKTTLWQKIKIWTFGVAVGIIIEVVYSALKR